MKLFLSSMCNNVESNLPLIRELLAPILPHLDGVVWVLHGEDYNTKSPCAEFLENVKGSGQIIYRTWVKRHDVSMNELLYTEKVEEDDWMIYCDLNELPAVEFVSKIKAEIIPMLEQRGIDNLAYYGKAYLFKYSETLQFKYSPHWVLTGFNRGADYASVEPDESKVRKNMRPIRRDKFEFVSHYLYYFLYPAGSNQALLGLDKRGGDIEKLFKEREELRLNFRRALKKHGYELSVDGVIEMMFYGIDEEMCRFIESDKILNDAYRYYLLGDRDFKDDHDWNNMVKVQKSEDTQ